jgi:hypothetical protein
VRNAVEDTATQQSQAPFGEFSNYGLVNAEAAVLRMLGAAVLPRPTVVRYITKWSTQPVSQPPLSRIYGRGLDSSHNITLWCGAQPVPIMGQSRDWLDFNAKDAIGSLTVKSNGVVVATIALPTSPAGTPTAYALSEASNPTAFLEGGFREAVMADSQVISCLRNSDGRVFFQATFRKVVPAPSMTLTIRRRFVSTAVGTENVYLYDWSSASYPYGNFVSMGSGPVPMSMTTSSFVVPDASRFVDPEGTMYLLITTSNDLPSGAVLEFDQAFIVPQ